MEQAPDYLIGGIELLAAAVAVKMGQKDSEWYRLTANIGDEFSNDVFALRSFCWCDQTREGHEDGCPPNFEHFSSGYAVTWYKYAGRGDEVNMQVDAIRLGEILADCLQSLVTEETEQSVTERK